MTEINTPQTTTTVRFEHHGEGPLPVIKEPIKDVIIRQSALSKLFTPIKVNVFIPNKKRPLKFEVPQTVTIGQLISICIKERNDMPNTSRPKKLIENPDAYDMRIALKNGKADENFPTYLSKTEITVENWKHWGYFLLVENQDFKQPSKNEVKQSIVHLQVFLPSGAYNILPVQINTKMKKVLESVCSKRHLTTSNYMAMTVMKTEDGEVWEEISGNKRVSDLHYLEITLVQKSHHLTFESEEVWYPGFATQEKTYHNIVYYKSKKLSGRGSSISLRIDAENISLIPIKKKSSKIIQIPTDEIISVVQNEIYQTKFQVECLDRILSFDAPNTTACKEILFKIQFLIDLERESQLTTPE